MPVVNDIYFYVRQGAQDQGPPVILIHGAGGTHLDWPPEIRRLTGRWVFALDLPGHGKSGGAGEQSIEAYANAVAGWMQEMQLARALLAGHAMGGAIALQMGLESGRLVSGLCLVASGARLPVSTDLLDGIANPASIHSAIDKLTSRSFSDRAPGQLLALSSRRLSAIRPSVLQGDLMASQEFDASDRLESFYRPVLVICGDQDRVTPLRYSQLLATKFPRASLAVVHEAGHMVALEQPQTVAARLEDFIREYAHLW